MNIITDALVIASGLPKDALVDHAAFAHNAAGMGVVCVMDGFYAVHTDGLEKMCHHRSQGFTHNALMPPGLPNAVAYMSGFGVFTQTHCGNGAGGVRLVKSKNTACKFIFSQYNSGRFCMD